MGELDSLTSGLAYTVMPGGNTAEVRALAESDKTTADGKQRLRLKNACQALESLFIGHLLKEMRATVDKSGFFSGGRAEELYTFMLDGQLAKELSSKGGIGLAALLLNDLERKPVK